MSAFTISPRECAVGLWSNRGDCAARTYTFALVNRKTGSVLISKPGRLELQPGLQVHIGSAYGSRHQTGFPRRGRSHDVEVPITNCRSNVHV